MGNPEKTARGRRHDRFMSLVAIGLFLGPLIASAAPTAMAQAESGQSLLQNAVCAAINVDPGQLLNREDRAVGFASRSGANLVRWRYWPTDSRIIDGFRIERTDILTGQTTEIRVTEKPADVVVAFLNGRDPLWPSLFDHLKAELKDIAAAEGKVLTDWQSVRDLIHGNTVPRDHLLDLYYPLAEALGRGYRDSNVAAGRIYRYDVIADVRIEIVGGSRAAIVDPIGTAVVTAGGPTPLSEPELVAMDLAPGAGIASPRSDDWSVASQNDRYHHLALLDLRDPPTPLPCAADAWTVGFDIFQILDGEQRLLTPDAPVVPGSPRDPTDQDPDDGVPSDAGYEVIDFDFAVPMPAPGTYLFCASGQDLFGRTVPFVAAASRPGCGEAIVHDYRPPGPPHVTATPVDRAVRVTWQQDPPEPVDHYEVYRAVTMSAAQSCQVFDESQCWRFMGTVAASAPPQFIDASVEPWRDYWYGVRAVDSSGNKGIEGGPAHTVLEDRTPPPIPILSLLAREDGSRYFQAEGRGDTSALEFFCDFGHLDDAADLDYWARAQGDKGNLDPADHFVSSGAFELSCSARAVNQRGVRSGFARPITMETPYDSGIAPFPTPILTGIKTVLGKPKVSWEFPETSTLLRFELRRSDLSDPIYDGVASAPPRADRTAVDNGVLPQHIYRYRIDAIAKDGRVTSSGSQVWLGVDGDKRTATQVPWKPGSPSFEAYDQSHLGVSGVVLTWTCDGCPSETTWAVYRSISRDSGYVQLTPVGVPHTVAHTDLDPVARDYTYKDPTGLPGRHHYVVLGFSGRTGEVAYYTPPGRASGTPALFSKAGYSEFAGATSPLLNGDCSTVSRPDFSKPLLFPGGFQVKMVFARVNAANQISGTARLVTPPTITPPPVVAVNGLRVSDRLTNTVCEGQVTFATTGSILVQKSLLYRVSSLRLRGTAWTPSTPMANVEILLPKEIVAAYGSTQAAPYTSVYLRNVRLLDSTFGFNHVVPAGTGTDPCEGALEFQLESLPLAIGVGKGVTFASNGISFPSSCIRYLDRHDVQRDPPVAGRTPRGIRHDVAIRLSNDGFLNSSTYQGSKLVILASGLHGEISTTSPIKWFTSVPYGFEVESQGQLRVMIANSRISGGPIDRLQFRISYLPSLGASPTPEEMNLLGGTKNATFRADGRIVSDDVPATGTLAWGTPGGYALTGARADLLLGYVTHPARPQAGIWAPDHLDAIRGRDLGVGRSPEADPGLNLRSSAAPLTWSCGGRFTFSTAADLYVRRGGVTGKFIAALAGPTRVDIYGFETVMEHYEVVFIDSIANKPGIYGNITLRGPAGFLVGFTNMHLGDDMCPAELDVKPTDVVARYWRIGIHVASAQIANEAMKSEGPTRFLWLGGSYEGLERLRNMDGSPATGLGTRTAFRPGGQVFTTELTQAKMPYVFNGMGIFLEKVRLSNAPTEYAGDAALLDGELPSWDPDATVTQAPDLRSYDTRSYGFLEIHGPLLVPGFGPSQAPDGELDKRARFQYTQSGPPAAAAVAALAEPAAASSATPADILGYVGATAKQEINRMWVNNSETLLSGLFDGVVYFPDPDITSTLSIGHLVVFDTIEIGSKGGDGEIPFKVDVGLVISPSKTEPSLPGRITGFLGISAGVGVLRAVAEIADDVDQDGGYDAAKKILAEKYASKLFPGDNAAKLDGDDGYWELLRRSWDDLKAEVSPADPDGTVPPDYVRTTLVLNRLEAAGKLPSEIKNGGGTGGTLKKSGIDIARVRGSIAFTGHPDWDFDRFDIGAKVAFTMNDGKKNIFSAESVEVTVEDSGKVIVAGSKIKLLDLGADFDLGFIIVVVPNEPSFEAGFELGGWEIEGTVSIHKAGLYLGIGPVYAYFGAIFDGTFYFGSTDVHAAGAVIFGKVTESSEVLKRKFPKVLESLKRVKDAGNPDPVGERKFTGFYLYATGDVPIIAGGCMLQVSVGGRLGLWYWTTAAAEVYGGQLGGYVRGRVACFITARGDMTLTYERPSGHNRLEGNMWVAVGVGLCDSGSWDSFREALRDDFCLVVGADGTLVYDDSLPKNKRWDFDYKIDFG